MAEYGPAHCARDSSDGTGALISSIRLDELSDERHFAMLRRLLKDEHIAVHRGAEGRQVAPRTGLLKDN